MNPILKKQLAIDFCCTEEAVESKENIFTEYTPLTGRRIFKEGECFLKAACVQGKILDLGRLPFYGTAMSHVASQKVALKAGFYPAWAELCCEKLCEK